MLISAKERQANGTLGNMDISVTNNNKEKSRKSKQKLGGKGLLMTNLSPKSNISLFISGERGKKNHTFGSLNFQQKHSVECETFHFLSFKINIPSKLTSWGGKKGQDAERNLFFNEKKRKHKRKSR